MRQHKSHRLVKGKRISSLLPCLASNESDAGTNGNGDDSLACNAAPRPSCSHRNNLPELLPCVGRHGRKAEPSKALHRYSHYMDGSHVECGISDSDGRKCAIHTTIEYTHRLVPNMVDIVNAPYYWGSLDRYEAEALLDGRPEGAFLLRDSAQPSHLFSISFRRYQRTLHARIEHSNGLFSFDIHDRSVFSTRKITELIAFYKDPQRCLFFEPQLSIPCTRNFVFSLQHLCRAVIADSTDYDSVGTLPIPEALKDLIREYHHMQPVKVTRH